MKKPTLEEVKEYFKNAETVKCIADGKAHETKLFTFLSKGDWIFEIGSYVFSKTERSGRNLDSSEYFIAWSEQKGYAKILTYKKPSFRPITMRCTQEQFYAVKGKLENLVFISDFEKFNYLTNNYEGKINKISNIHGHSPGQYDREVYETWNEKVFLEACGIEVEEEENFVITKEQIKSLYSYAGANNQHNLEKWFPKAFEEEKKDLVVGRWHFVERPKSQFNDDQKALIFYEDKDKLYGFTHGRWWTNDYGNPKSDNYIFTEATEQEVSKALKKEYANRGFKKGVYYNCNGVFGRKDNVKCGRIIVKKDSVFCTNNGWIFFKGKWAEIIPTISLKEAEERLNCKIV